MFDVREYQGGMFDWQRQSKFDPDNPYRTERSTPTQVNARRQVTQTCSLLTRLYRVLSGNSKLLVNDMGAAGWRIYGMSKPPALSTDDGRVFIDFTHKAFKEMYGERAFAHTLGLGYHELAHRLYTPMWVGRWITDMTDAVIGTRNGKIAYNILEDGRIERLLATEYGAIHAYLAITFMTVVDYQTSPESTWIITAPRASRLDPYLVDLLKQAARSSATRSLSDETLDETLDICNQYNRLVLPRDSAEAASLVKQYAKIITDMQQDMREQGEYNAANDSETILRGRHEEDDLTDHREPSRNEGTERVEQRSQQQQEEAQREADKREESQRQQVSAGEPDPQDSEEEDEEDGSGSAGDADDEAQDDADEAEGGSGDSDADEDAEDADGDDSGSGGDAGEDADSGDDGDAGGDGSGEGDGGGKEDGEEDSTGSGGTGAGSGSGDLDYGDEDDRYDPEDLRDAIAEALQQDMDAAINSDTVKEDLKGHRSALSSGRNFVSTALPYAPTGYLPVSAEDRAAVRRLGRLFDRLTHQLEPGWEARTSSGKFNPLRFVQEEDASTAYDQWHEDRTDAANVEVALCMDVSGSMGSHVLGENGLPTSVSRLDAAARMSHILRLVVAGFGGKVTGFGYDSVTRLMFTSDERAKTDRYPTWDPQGSTHVTESLCQAQLVMRASRAQGKVVIVVSDGAFSDHRDSVADMADALRGEGAQVLRFLVGGRTTAVLDETNDPYHGIFDLSQQVRDPMDMVEPIQQLIQQLIKEAGKIR